MAQKEPVPMCPMCQKRRKEMELTLTQYFLLFMIYSVAGWVLEVTCKLIEYKRFINRGFLIGPYCPIYGWGAVAITFLLYRYSYDPLILFFMTLLTCSILEYATSWVMEKLFKARWWDYSKRKFNVDGRVCLGTMIPFGIFGMILTYVTNPLIISGLDKVNPTTLNIIAIVLLVIYLVDNVISSIVIFGFRKTTVQVGREGRQDNTEQITKKVREILSSKSWMYKRLVDAYPKLIAIKTKIKEIKEEVKENAIEVKNSINEKAQDMKNTISEKKDEVKNTISEKIKGKND
ncbi:MAG: putative ABC transporter permease [Clostridia bacterium]